MGTELQLPGLMQGLKAAPRTGQGASEGSATSPEDGGVASFGEELEAVRSAMRDAGLEPEQLSPELLALLQQWLTSGTPLPAAAVKDTGDGQSLPPLAAWLRFLEGGGTGVSTGGASPGMPGILSSFTPVVAGGKEMVMDAALREFRLKPGLEAMALPQTDPRQASLITAAAPLTPGVASTGSPVPNQNLLAMPIPQPVGGSGWAGALGERLIWMAKGEQQHAELKITPPNLGPMEVRLTINDDKASVSFVSQHALVRDALEAALPRLREMLAQESLQLVQADVGGGQGQGGDQADFSTHAGSGGNEAGSVGLSGEDIHAAKTPLGRRGIGLLDLFA